MASDSSLLSKLESSDSQNIHHLFSEHLHPFIDLINPKKTTKKPSKLDEQQSQSLTRSLAKKFLPFLNRALSILPKRLGNSTNDGESEAELFRTFELCLNCLEAISSQLSCKAYTIYIQRVRLVHCYVAAGQYNDAENQGFRVLERLTGVDRGRWLVPSVKGGEDAEFGWLVVEVVAMLVKCVAMRQSKDIQDYRRVLSLVEQIRPWFRVLDASAYEKLHRVLVTYLGKCTLFVAGELIFFGRDLVRECIVAAFTEYAKSSSMDDQIYKFANRICSSLFLQQEKESVIIIDLLICILDSVAQECKVGIENNGEDFVELVSYCANKCRTLSSPNLCSALATHLFTIAGDCCKVVTPIQLILRLYAAGLYFADPIAKSRNGDFKSSKSVECDSAIRTILDDGDRFQCLAALLCPLDSYFHIDSTESCVSSSVECKSRKAFLPFYLNALRLLCQPLAELVNSERKQIFADNEDDSVYSKLCIIWNAFHQFCDAILFRCNSISGKERDGFDGNNKMTLSVAVAAFTLSTRTKLKMQKTVNLIKHIMATDWIQPDGLKFLFASLYNVSVTLYRNKKVKEASKALKLCCQAAWTCVILLCQMFINKSKDFFVDLSEDSVVNFVTEACSKSAFLLDVLQQCGNHKVESILVDSLENWSTARNLFRRLPGPMPLVKQWVKIECKLHKNVDVVDGAPTLYSLLSTSAKVSKQTIGIILEQELLAYEEMDASYPKFCRRMEEKILDILLQNVYVTQDSLLQRSKILIRKGRALRGFGTDGLNKCLQCLSEAISTIELKQSKMSQETRDISVRNQLAVAHCLRALCTQEAEPNSKRICHDINAALNLWLSIPVPDQCSEDEQQSIVSENTILLLYNIVDLLSIKGCMDFHNEIYKLIFRLFKSKNVSKEKCLGTLWESRRLSHALCVSPITEAFTHNLSEYCGECCKSIDFWIGCLKDFRPLVVSFQQNFSYLFTVFPRGFYSHKSSFQPDITVDEVKKVALELISSGDSSQVPVASSSVFLAGYLYYDLCQRLISNGRLFEALSCAKEAHRLRTKLFQEKFMYSVEQQTEKCSETGEIIRKLTCSLSNLQVIKPVADDVWSFNVIPWSMGGYLSPWNVLQCYLESTLQVGIINELIGNGAEAETFLLWGKNIACSQSLSLFVVSFSSVLGKLYRKKQLWDLAEHELRSANKILVDTSATISCVKCRLMLDATINQQLGDLSRSHLDGTTDCISIEGFVNAENLYKSALDNLNLSEWRNSISCPKDANSESLNLGRPLARDAEYGARNALSFAANQSDARVLHSTLVQPKALAGNKKGRKTKNTQFLKEHPLKNEQNSRVTRSRFRSSQNGSVGDISQAQTGLGNHLDGDDVCDTHCRGELLSEINHFEDASCSEVMCSCGRMKCWQCLPIEVMESQLVDNYIHLKWEFARRQLLLRLLNSIGKCLGIRGQAHEAHQIFLQSISVLVSRNPFCHTSAPPTFLLDLLEKEMPQDVLAVERATLLYNICWFSLKSYQYKDARFVCCCLSNIQLHKLVAWLMLAFVLSREVPNLFQKVSRLLAIIYILSTSSAAFSLSSSCNALSESHWASYFHQASLGTHLSHQFFSNIAGKSKTQHLVDLKGSNPAFIGPETDNSFSLATESVQDLEEFVRNFFVGLPCTTVICISLLGGAYASLLQELMLHPYHAHAWMILSRLNSKNQPIVLLLPVDSILEETSDDDANSGSGEFSECKNVAKHWHCPWGDAVVNNVAPAFKLILEENYLSSSIFPLEDTKKNRLLWWARRKKLDEQLGQLLRNLEDSWLGPWRCYLLGEWSNCKSLGSVHKKLIHDLKTKCKVDVNEDLLKIVLGVSCHASESDACLSQLNLNKACYIGRVRNSADKSSDGVEEMPALAFKLVCEAVKELEEEACESREPVILVLDCEVQMLPWENMPTLRNQEVYRMPSVGSISAMLDVSRCRQEKVGRSLAGFPLIDPLDAFYLLNPSGDLSSTQVEFESWFRDQNLEGKAGSAPTAEELALVLKRHDLFLYFGHGSGSQYIPTQEIQKLENCAATLLMGCSSGSLSLNGCYIPQGTPLSYLLAGSPVIVANLWEVTDKDIDRFAKAMLDAWLRERTSLSVNCDQCNLLAKEFEALNVRGCKGNAKKKVSRKKVTACDGASCEDSCGHRPKIGSFMGQAREACTLPFLIGASPVCYGIPTGIWKKKDL